MPAAAPRRQDRKSTRLNSSHMSISYAVFCLKKTRAERRGRPGGAGYSLGPGSRRDCRTILCFFNDAPTPEIYTLSLHDALPILPATSTVWAGIQCSPSVLHRPSWPNFCRVRSEEHTSELQSHVNLVCRLLL